MSDRLLEVAVGEVSDLIEALRAELGMIERPSNALINFVGPLLAMQFARILLDEPALQSEVLW